MATVCITYDFDAVSVWINAYESGDNPLRLNRGLFGADVAAPRLLDLHDDHGVPSTWFIPGHTIESFPEICGAIWDRGHDVQHHSWSHLASPRFGDRDAELADFERAIENIRDLTGRPPTGYRAPGYAWSDHTLDILLELGFEWDSSIAGATEFTPYYVRENWKAPRDEPYDRGRATDLVELPLHWRRDDFPALEFVWRPLLPGYFDEASVFASWRDQFDWMYDNVENGVFILVFHPQTIGKASHVAKLDDLLGYFDGKPGVEFSLLDDVAADFRAG